MSLINDKQRENSQQDQPTIKPIQSAAAAAPEELSFDSVGTGEEFQLSSDTPEQAPVSNEVALPQSNEAGSALDFSLTSPAQTQVEGGFVPQDPRQIISAPTAGARNIWESVPDDKSPYAPEILQTSKPTTYDSSRINSQAAILDATGLAGLSSSFDKYNSQQQKAAQAEADFRASLNNRTENVNIPRKQQPWGSMVGQAFNDLLFGSKQSQQEAENNVVNPFKLQYGKQGAGVGGWVKYVLSTPLNATVGLASDINQATVNTLTKFGVSKEQAQRFARGGVLGMALDAAIGKEKTDALGKRFGLQQDWSKTERGSATVEAIVRGAFVGDLNDPKGTNKGVFYREARPRRTQQEIDKASFGKYDIVGAGGIVQAAKDDPVGAGYEILANIIDPAGNKLGDVVSAGIRNLGKAPARTTAKAPAKGVQTPAVMYPAKKPQRALPPGKVQGTPVEQQLEQMWGNNIPAPPRKPGEARLPPGVGGTPLETPDLPLLPGLAPAGGFPKVNLGDGIPVTGTRVISPDEGYLPMGGTRKKPTKFISFPSDQEQLAKVDAELDPWKPLDEEPVRMGATLDEGINTSTPRLKPAPYASEAVIDPWSEVVDFVDVAFEPITSSAATPTKAPRIYQGDFRVVQKALPPAIENVDEVIPEAIIGTPSEVVFRVGIGTPSAEPIVFSDDIRIPELEKNTQTLEVIGEAQTTSPIPEPPKVQAENTVQAAKQSDEVQEFVAPNAPAGGLVATDEITEELLEQADSLGGQLQLSVVDLQEKYPTHEHPSIGARMVEAVSVLRRNDPKALLRSLDDSGLLGYVINNSYETMSKDLGVNIDRLRDSLVNALINKGKELDFNETQKAVLNIIRYASEARVPDWLKLKAKELGLEWGGSQWRRAGIKKATTEQLEQAAEQLSSHKAVVQAPLQQLDKLFDDTIDFGRRTTDEIPYSVITPDGVYSALENNAKLNIPVEAIFVLGKRYGDDVAEALADTDYIRLSDLVQEKQIDLETFVKEIAETNNGIVNGKAVAAKVTPEVNTKTKASTQNVASGGAQTLSDSTKQFLEKTKGEKITFSDSADLVDEVEEPKEVKLKRTRKPPDPNALRNTVKMPPKVLHGTALANWQPSYNLRLNGSRGELGSGLYVTNRLSVAQDYAKAVISENVSPGANAKDISPSVYELSHKFEQTFSARGKLAPTDPIVKAIISSLPEQLQEAVRKSLNRDSSTNLVGVLNKIEASLVRSSLSPTEETLKDINLRVSDTLRSLGYDSIYDTKSGFGVVLDETRVNISKSKPVPPASSSTQAALARYNADAYAAKFYQERLTTDANLRDSAYKLLSQLESNIDDKLREVQQEIMKRGLQERSTVLPPKQQFKQGVSLNDSKPNTISEVLDTVEPKSVNPCEF